MSPTALMGSEANSERAKVQQFQYNDEIITLFFGNSNVILYVFLLERRDAEIFIIFAAKRPPSGRGQLKCYRQERTTRKNKYAYAHDASPLVYSTLNTI